MHTWFRLRIFMESEYVGEFFKCRHFLTGFNGTAGTAVITMDKAGLWTDGRYFIQAAQQLEGTPVTLFKMGEPDVPTIHKFLEEKSERGNVSRLRWPYRKRRRSRDARKNPSKKTGTFFCK